MIRLLQEKNSNLIGARKLFPCFDEPSYKAVFDIVIKHPVNYSAYANTPHFISKDHKYTLGLTEFHKTPRIPTYMLDIMLVKYNDKRIRNEVTFDDYTVKEVIQDKAEKLMEDYLDISLPVNWTSLPYE